MKALFAVRLALMSTGERMWVVVDTRTGEPAFLASLYTLLELRRGAGSHGTIAQALMGVAALLTFLTTRGIDIVGCITSRAFLSRSELDGLVAVLYQGSTPGAPVRAQTVAIRIGAISAFLGWLIDEFCYQRCQPSERRIARQQADQFLGRLAGCRPKVRSRKGKRLGLSAAQLAALFAALQALADSANRSGSTTRMAVADRTLLWFEFLVEFGLRTGELLSLKVCDFNFEKLSMSIERRPDDDSDKRRDNPRVKGLERDLPLSPYLARRTQSHIKRWRAGRPRSKLHDHLFVSTAGDQLSRSTVNRLFQSLREEVPLLGPGFCNHVMRHTWNEAFSDAAEAEGLTEGEAAEARATIMGWSDPRTARIYLGSRRRRQLAAITARCQEQATRRAGGAPR